jgi:hypothetical protein
LIDKKNNTRLNNKWYINIAILGIGICSDVLLS